MVRSDRADTNTVGAVLDLVLMINCTAVPDEDGAGKLLVKHETHLTLEPRHNIKVSDVDHVVTIELLLLVDGRGRGGPLLDTEELFLLHRALDVTLCTGLIQRQVSAEGLDPRERALADPAQHRLDPLGTTLIELGNRGQSLGIREQNVNVIDAVRKSELFHSVLEGTTLGSVSHDALDIGVAKGVSLRGLIVALLEDIAHFGTILFGIVSHVVLLKLSIIGFVDCLFVILIGRHSILLGFATRLDLTGRLESFTNHVMHNILLLISQSVVDIGNRFLVGVASIFTISMSKSGLFGRLFLRLFKVRMLNVFAELQLKAGVDYSLIINCVERIVRVTNRDILDESARVSPGKHQRYLTDCSMKHAATSLNEIVRPNGQHLDVLMLQKTTGVICLLRVVEEAVGVNAISALLQDRVTQHILRVTMAMLPHKRDLCLILMRERLRHDGTTIAALEPRLCSVAAEIGFHIGLSFLRSDYDTFSFSRWSICLYCSTRAFLFLS